MKLPELKTKFKNKYAIRIISGVLIVALAGTGVSASRVQAAKNSEAETSTEAAAEDEKETDSEDTLKNALNSSLTINEKEIGKEETVYVITDSVGGTKEVIVSDHLINNDNKDTIEDASNLSDIQNVKGDETFTQNGTKVTWQADGNDIYYQGTSEEEPPISQKITYYLDGKEIAPEDLAGESGKVTIRFDYTNNEKVKTTIDGKETEVCVPFVAVSGMILDDSFSNIEVKNGKVMADGNNNLVIGYTLPGLKESLNVEDSDFDADVSIPDYFEVTADVEEFSLETTMTVVMNATSFISTEGENDLSTVDDLLETLTDATSQLQDGSAELAEGMDTLQSKLGEFSDGVNTLKDGIRSYTDGAAALSDGIGTLKSGVDTLTGSVPALTDGVGQLKNGADSAATGASALASGAGNLKDGIGTLSAGARDVAAGAVTLSTGANELSTGANDLSTGVQSLAAGAKELLDGANTLSAGAASLNDGVGTLVTKIQGMETELDNGKNGIRTEFESQAGMSYDNAVATVGQLNELRGYLVQGINAEAVGDTAAAGQYYDAVNGATGSSITNAAGAAIALVNIDDSISALQGGIAKVDGASLALDQVKQSLVNEETSTQLAALQAGAGQVSAGAADLAAGVAALSSGADSAATGAADLAAGAAALSSGADALSAGAGQVSAGADQVLDGSNQVAAGAASLSDGLNVLDAGLNTLNEKAGALGTGATQLKNGTDQLAAGAGTLVANNVALNDGAAALSDGTGAIVDGVGALSEGAHQLADGIVEFNEEGIEKILNSYNGDIEPLMQRIQAVLDAGEDYQSYTAIADGVNGSVKFIYKTDAIKESN